MSATFIVMQFNNHARISLKAKLPPPPIATEPASESARLPIRLLLACVACMLLGGCTIHTSKGKLSMLKPPAPAKNRPALALNESTLGPLHLAYTFQRAGCFSDVRVGKRGGDEIELSVSYQTSSDNSVGLYNLLVILNLATVLPGTHHSDQVAKFTVVDARGIKHVYEYSDGFRSWTGLLVPAPGLIGDDKQEILRNNLRKMCSHLLVDMEKDGLLALREGTVQPLR